MPQFAGQYNMVIVSQMFKYHPKLILSAPPFSTSGDADFVTFCNRGVCNCVHRQQDEGKTKIHEISIKNQYQFSIVGFDIPLVLLLFLDF